jgi:hypothetical protein
LTGTCSPSAKETQRFALRFPARECNVIDQLFQFDIKTYQSFIQATLPSFHPATLTQRLTAALCGIFFFLLLYSVAHLDTTEDGRICRFLLAHGWNFDLMMMMYLLDWIIPIYTERNLIFFSQTKQQKEKKIVSSECSE